MEAVPALLFVLALSLGITCLAFWIWMIVDCVKHESSQGNDKLVWLVIIVATKFIGALIYYFVRRPERIRLASAER